MDERTDEMHSARFFTEARDLWWNPDFLELMARRLGLAKVKAVLDVGCGQGHWTAAVLPMVAATAKVVGVDREPAWVEKASHRFKALADRVSFHVAPAEALPFADASFDLVTCQTLLIHVRDPHAVIREMLRVLKPGGLLLAVEPSNQAQTGDSVDISVEDLVDLKRLELFCQDGKAALGEGFNSIGDLLPGILAMAGLSDIRCFIGDRTTAVYPPYASEEQKIIIKEELKHGETGDLMFGKEQTRRYFLAGGGSEFEFSRLWDLVTGQHRKKCEAIRAGAYHAAGGTLLYLVSGTKGPARSVLTRESL